MSEAPGLLVLGGSCERRFSTWRDEFEILSLAFQGRCKRLDGAPFDRMAEFSWVDVILVSMLEFDGNAFEVLDRWIAAADHVVQGAILVGWPGNPSYPDRFIQLHQPVTEERARVFADCVIRAIGKSV